MTARWRPHTERPTESAATALIAVLDPEDNEIHLLGDIFMWSAARAALVSESTGEPVHEETYWWMPELELLAEVPR